MLLGIVADASFLFGVLFYMILLKGEVHAGHQRAVAKMSRDIWDFDTINREVPIEDVLAFHGIHPERGKYRIREDDDHASASIHPQKKYGNTIHDFGYGNNFTPLTLTMYLQGVDKMEASRILGEAFHIPPVSKGKDGDDVDRISDFDWKMLGIYPDMVSKNIDFDLEKYGITSTMRLSEKYRMSMSELRDMVVGEKDASKVDDRDKRWYENILRNKAVPFVYEERYEYFRRMNDDFKLAKAVNGNVAPAQVFQIHHSDYEEFAKKLSQMELAMKKVIEGTSVKFNGRFYNPDKDFLSVINGEVSFEIGMTSHYEVSSAAYRDKAKVFYCVVSMNEYYKLLDNGLDNIKVAAKQKGDTVTLSFQSTDSGKVNYLVKALRGKEAFMAESLGEALTGAQAEKKDVVIQTKATQNQPEGAKSAAQTQPAHVISNK